MEEQIRENERLLRDVGLFITTCDYVNREDKLKAFKYRDLIVGTLYKYQKDTEDYNDGSINEEF